MPRQLRAVLRLAYVVYLGWLVYLVWTPSPSLPGGVITRVVAAFARMGVTVSADTVELALNIVMLMPLSLIGGLLFRRLRVSDWTALGFVASLTIEVVQGLALPTRSGSSRDVVANTLGSLLGALSLAVLLALIDRGHRAPRAPEADDACRRADKMTA